MCEKLNLVITGHLQVVTLSQSSLCPSQAPLLTDAQHCKRGIKRGEEKERVERVTGRDRVRCKRGGQRDEERRESYREIRREERVTERVGEKRELQKEFKYVYN